MRPRRSLVLLTAAFIPLLLAGPGSAGTAERPEITDPRGDARDPAAGLHGDLVAGWIENETESGFVTVLQLDRVDPRLAAGTLYRFAMTLGDAHYFTDAFVNHDGSMFYGYGTLKADRREPEVITQERTTGTVTAGTPGYVRVVFQKAILPARGLNESGPRVLEALEGITGDSLGYAAAVIGPETPWVVDRAPGTTGYALNDTLAVPAEEEITQEEAPPEANPPVPEPVAAPDAPPPRDAHTPAPFPGLAILALAAALRSWRGRDTER